MQSQNNQIRSDSMRMVCAILIAIFCVTGCGNRQNQNLTLANSVLTKVGKFAEDSFYSCLLNGYAQGLSVAQARGDCATKLVADDKKGFGGSIEGIRPGRDSFFDPSKITAACNTGDPTHSQSSGYVTVPGYGSFTYGGDPNKFYGLTKDESERQKTENIAESVKEYAKFDKLVDEDLKKTNEKKEAEKKGDDAAAKKADKEQKAAYQAALDQLAKAKLAEEKAKGDPNKKPQPVGRPVAGDSTCEQALDAGRELLRECHRTQWKDFRCQQLQARIGHCPDPALILVDPEQGYVCGAKIDPEAVKNAWVAQCKQRIKVVPDTADPCLPPTFDKSERFGQGNMGDICSNPYAQIDPENEKCSVVEIGKEFGKIDIQEVIVIALNKLGGPIVIIPKNPKPSPHPGSDPRPGPRPN